MTANNAELSPTYIAEDLFSPVIHKWITDLHQFICYYNDGNTKFLFNARAGVRIRHLYELFLEGRGLQMDDAFSMFWASRLSVAKGTFAREPSQAIDLIAREYFYSPLSSLLSGVLRNNPDLLKRIKFSDARLSDPGSRLGDWLNTRSSAAQILRTYLNECGSAMDDYIDQLMGGRRRAVIIDSGWQGTAQTLLSEAYPDYAWKGLYFGRCFLPGTSQHNARDIIGLLFESDHYDPARPETAFVRHRHLIESLLEPNAPSIEEVPAGRFLQLVQPAIDANRTEHPNPSTDFFYDRAISYFRQNAGLTDLEILRRHQNAMPELARVIIHPSAAEAKSLAAKERSADFGKELLVPVLIQPPVDDKALGRQQRIKDALWQEGQIALELEHDPRSAFEQQSEFALTGHPDKARNPPETIPVQGRIAIEPIKPVVAIITRTKNRPILLKRASESVAAQTYGDYIWVIVNDGGDEEAVAAVVRGSPVDRRKIIIVSNPKSMGMEAASNIGARAANSDYLVIHDDDDSWHPQFLQRTVAFLEGSTGRRYGGVITRCEYVSEEILGESVIEHGRRPYMEWVRNVQLAEMASGNIFAPISFIYRRSLFDDIGGYNESLPVLGDWYFNMEFLLRADVGVIPEVLAFYHHRDKGSHSPSYANSVIGGISKHEEFLSVASNEFVRRNAAKYPAALAVIMGFGVRVNRWGFDQLRLHPRGTDGPAQDLEDKYWCAAQINLAVSKNFFLRFKGMRITDPAQTWEEVRGVLLRSRKRLPAPPDFDESMYLRLNPDVAKAIRQKKVPNAYFHYIAFGRGEGRARATR